MDLGTAVVGHALGLAHHLFTIHYTKMQIDWSELTSAEVLDVKKFSMRYLTLWNMVLQALYLAAALAHDVLLLRGGGVTCALQRRLAVLRGYMFVSLVFPLALLVAGMFWPIYWLDRELVLPRALDQMLPGWVNHGMHTNILLVPVFELVQPTRLRVPARAHALLGLTCLAAAYYAVFFGTYVGHGRWIYALYERLSWPQRLGLAALLYAAGVALQAAGFRLQRRTPLVTSTLDLLKTNHATR